MSTNQKTPSTNNQPPDCLFAIELSAKPRLLSLCDNDEIIGSIQNAFDAALKTEQVQGLLNQSIKLDELIENAPSGSKDGFLKDAYYKTWIRTAQILIEAVNEQAKTVGLIPTR